MQLNDKKFSCNAYLLSSRFINIIYEISIEQALACDIIPIT